MTMTDTTEREALGIAFAALNRLAGRDSWSRTLSEDPHDPWESAESQGLAAIEAVRAALSTPPAAADDWQARALAAEAKLAAQAAAVPATGIEAVAQRLALFMDYPWEHMPEEGRARMRVRAKGLIAAAQGGASHG